MKLKRGFTALLFLFLFLAAGGNDFVFADAEEALETAKSYLTTMPFSRKGLMQMLEYAGYTHEEAEYAVDNCGADWMQQAAASAAYYLSSSDYSENGLIRQLESDAEGFTHEEAVYGVETAGKSVDWNEMAVNRAGFYLNSGYFSEKGLLRQLESESVGFTHDQALQAVNTVAQTTDWNEIALKRAGALIEKNTYSEAGLLRQLESESVGFTHDQAVYAVGIISAETDWNEMAAKKASDFLNVISASRPEVIAYLESEGFTHEQAVYGTDNSGQVWSDMTAVLADNLDNLFPINGLEEKFTTPVWPAYSDIGPETSLRTVIVEGLNTIHLFTNPDFIHDYIYINRVNAGHLVNFMFSMDVTLEDVYPYGKAGCFIGYKNELPAAWLKEEPADVFLIADGNGVGFYYRTGDEVSGSFTRIFDQPRENFHLSLIRFTGHTYAFIDYEYAGEFEDKHEGPFQLVYGNAVFSDGDTAVCSFDNLSVRKVNN